MNCKLLFVYVGGLCITQPAAAFAAREVAAPSNTNAVPVSENGGTRAVAST
jgi:hypothetical protein